MHGVLRVARLEVAPARNQPAHQQRGLARQQQRPASHLPTHRFCRARHLRQPGMDAIEQQAACGIEKHTAIAALKQLRPQLFLHRAHRATDGSMGQVSSSAARLKLSSRAAASKQRKATSEGIRCGPPAEIGEFESLFS
jgi:hypothetical protein